MNKLKFKWSSLYLVIVFLVLYAPIIYLTYYSFNSGGSMHEFEGFTLKWYKEVFEDTRLLIIVLNTLVIALLSGALSTILGVIGALAIHEVRKRRMRNTLLSLNNVLIVSPDVIIGASFLILFTLLGIKLGFVSVLLAHIAFSVPIVVLMVLPRLQEMSPTLIDAALDLGASRWHVLSRVVLPFIKSGVFAGFFMALTYSLDDFAVTFFVTGNGYATLSVEIYSRARQGISLSINALSTLIFLLTILLVTGYYVLIRRSSGSERASGLQNSENAGGQRMKSLVRTFLAIFIVAFALLYLASFLNKSQGYSGDNTLTIYNWGDYIDPKLLTEFQKETGITVIYQTFDSNEAMMTKIEQGGTTFDVAVPSEYAIDKMKQGNLLYPLDHSKLSNLSHIDPRFLNLSFDTNNTYSIPYFWGTVGIIYNPELVPEGMTFDSWDDLWDPRLKNNILLVDGAREVMGFSLNSLGYSLNDRNEDHLQAAKQKLSRLTPNVKAIVGDEIKLLLAGEEAGVGVVWSGDAAEIMNENDKLNYVIPQEGSNLWFDNMVIPKTARNVDGAYKFINFMLEPGHAAQNAEYVGYSTPNKDAVPLLPQDISEDERFYPSEELTNKLEVYDNLGKRMLAHYNELFLEFKMHRK